MNKRTHKYVEVYRVNMNPDYRNFAVGPNLLKEEKLKFCYKINGKDYEKIVPTKYFGKFLNGPIILNEYNKFTRQNEYKGYFYSVDLQTILDYEEPKPVEVEKPKHNVCKMKEQFYLAHVVLYAKRWYEWTEDIYNDLSKMLALDGYTGYSKYEREGIARRLLNAYREWSNFLDTCIDYHYTHGMKHLEEQQFHLYKRSNDPKWNMTDYFDIVVMSVLIEFSHAENEYMNIPCPEYSEENLPGKVGLIGNFEDWYEEANQNGINGNKNLAKFFNEKVKDKWKEFE